MGRNHKDWLSAYIDTYYDEFVPKQFFTWCGISCIAAALERKVWLPISRNYTAYPNLYVMLVSGPGIGKSSAIQPAVRLLSNLKSKGNEVPMLPTQVTEAMLIQMLSRGKKTFEHKGKIHYYTPYYYFASEASAGMKDIYGGFTEILTELYDCSDKFERGVKGDGPKPTSVVKPCVNLLAGSTFSYLNKLIGGDNISGGFASRLIYVVQQGALERTFKILRHDDEVQLDSPVQPVDEALLQDLSRIQSLRGPFRGTTAFYNEWEAWNNSNDKIVQGMDNENLRDLQQRTAVNINKVTMCMCASSGDDMLIQKEHFEAAVALVNEVRENLIYMLRESRSRDTRSQTGLNNYIFKLLVAAQGRAVPYTQITSACTMYGYRKDEITKTLQVFINDNSIIEWKDQHLKLIGDVDMYIK